MRHALNIFVWSMRRLLGQVHCFDEAIRLGILPGSRSVDKEKIPRVNREVILGLVLLTGSLPISHINPGGHHFVHTGGYTFTHALLSILWMMGFERYNFYLKNLIRNGYQADIHLANSVAIDIAASYLELCKTGIKYDVHKAPQHTCFLSQPLKHVTITRQEIGDLRMCGCAFEDALSIDVFSTAHVLGVHFHAGQWGKRPTCSSVFTCVANGRSVYGYVNRYICQIFVR